MPVHGVLNRKQGLRYLDVNYRLATIYFVYLVPKTQQDAVRLIYRIRNEEKDRPSMVNRPFKWIPETRHLLMRSGYLIRCDHDIRNPVIKSDIEPIIQSIVEILRPNTQNNGVLKATKLVLDSCWFRGFFSEQNIHNPFTYPDGSVYEPFRNMDEGQIYETLLQTRRNTEETSIIPHKLRILGIENRIFQLLGEIGYYSYYLRLIFMSQSQEKHCDTRDPLLTKLLKCDDFDEYLTSYQQEIPVFFMETLRRCMRKVNTRRESDPIPKQLMIRLLHHNASLFMPCQVSMLLRMVSYESEFKPSDFAYMQQIFPSEREQEMREWGI